MFENDLDRRTFLAATGVASIGALAGCTGGDSGSDGDGSSDDGSSGDGTEVTVGPDGEFVFDPEELTVSTGTTVTFVWDSNNHNLSVNSGPDDGWSGYEDIEDEGFEYEHTFEVAGEYEYVCVPHQGQGMVGTIIVEE